MNRWRAVDPPRRVCLVLGAAIAAFGVVQIGALIVWSTVASVWLNSMLASGSVTGAGLSHQGPLAILLRFPLSTQTLWVSPVVAGLAGVLVYRMRSPRTGQVIVALATVCMVAAALTRVAIGGVNAPTMRELVSPLTDSTITALPFCIVLGLVSMRVSKLTAPRAPGSSAQDPMLTVPAP
jgi:hypothetical protein